MLRALILFCAGIFCYDRQWPVVIDVRLALAVTVIAACLNILLAWARSSAIFVRMMYGFSFMLMFSGFGWCSYSLADVRNKSDWFGKLTSDTTALTLVRIEEEPRERASGTRLSVKILGRLDSTGLRPATGKALLYVFRKGGAAGYSPGDSLLVPAQWQLIKNAGNPFELDNEAFQRRRNIFHQQFLSPDAVELYGSHNDATASIVARIHRWADRQLRSYVPDSAALGLLQAMLLGDESNFDEELRTAYSQTGVIHIVSISGSHVAVLFLVIAFFFRWSNGRYSNCAKYVLGLALVWLYVLVAGAPPSALRSALMFSVFALAGISGLEGNPLNTLSCAAFVLLAGEPAWLFSVGFQLSFGAVLSMLLFYQPLFRLFYWPNKYLITRWIWAAVSASLAAEILTAPLVIYYFHNFPLMFLLANMVAALMAGLFALVGGLAIIAFCWAPPLAKLFGWMVSYCVRVFNELILLMQNWNFPALQHLRITTTELVLCYLLIAAAGVWWLRRSRRGLLTALPLAAVLVFLLTADAYQSLKQQRLIVYNNGKAPAIDLLQGYHYQSIAGAECYNAQAARTGFGAWRKMNGKADVFLLAGGKRILIITDSSVNQYERPFPVDVLILARPLRQIRVANFLQVFRPKEVVLTLRASAYHQQRWADSCAAHGIHLHSVATHGAYIR